MSAITISNVCTGEVFYDTLHNQQLKPLKCEGKVCSGSSMSLYGFACPLAKEEAVTNARNFITEYYSETGCEGSMEVRRDEVVGLMESQGYYELTPDEVLFGAKTAWRNAPRCVGRIHWRNLELFDCRKVIEPDEAFKEICKQMEFATNDGNLRPSIALFPPKVPGKKVPLKIWNKQLVNFAGYKQPDGTVIGDKAYVEFTQFCESLGWKGRNGQHDVLPLVISKLDEDPKFYALPSNLALTVKIRHPTIKAIETLNLEWYALPAVSGMQLEVGGIQFPCAPFNGWYAVSEIATRNFLDHNRYDLSEKIGKMLGLDTSSATTYWKDVVSTEMNKAVFHSFAADNVFIADHYSLADSFMEHFQNEHKVRGGCPGDWVWIVPPLSGSVVPTFHQEMLNYNLSPCFDYQEDPLQKHRRQKSAISLKVILISVYFAGSLFNRQLKKRQKAKIYYGSETGATKRYSERLLHLLSKKYNVKENNITACSLDQLKKDSKNEALVFLPVSTFGNGDAPSDAIKFKSEIKKALASKSNTAMLKGLKFAIFARGSSQYPKFCEFGKFLDKSLKELGGTTICQIGFSDDMVNPEEAFKQWVEKLELLKDLDNQIQDTQKFENKKRESLRRFFMKSESEIKSTFDLGPGKPSFDAVLQDRHFEDTDVMLLRFDYSGYKGEFNPGDTLAIYPSNPNSEVTELLKKAKLRVRKDLIMKRAASTYAPKKRYEAPHSNQDRRLLRSFFDLREPISQQALRKLIKYASDPKDKESLTKLSKDLEAYKAWKVDAGGIAWVLDQFKSIEILPSNLILEILSPIQPRWYSLASYPTKSNNMIEIVVSVVQFKTKDGSYRKGLCSNFLKDLEVGSKILLFHSPAFTLEKPLTSEKPIVMIAAGSGIAPFRSVWEYLKAKDRINLDENVLFFGCLRDNNNLFHTESEDIVDRIVAFSRKRGAQSSYVQDQIIQEREIIQDLVFNKGGSILVCGSVSMAEGVKESLLKLIKQSLTNLDMEKANEYFEELKNDDRYIEEIYGTAS